MKGKKNAPIEVYDLQNDPSESNNVASRQPEIVKRALAYMDSSSTQSPYYPYPAKLMDYIEGLKKEDGVYGWDDQSDGHLKLTFAGPGIPKSLGMSDSGKQELADYIRSHLPQYGVNQEAGGRGADVIRMRSIRKKT